MTIDSGLTDAPPRVGVTIVLWHSELDVLTAGLRSLEAQSVPPVATAILVNGDDGSVGAELTGRLASLSLDNLTIVSERENRGFAAGHDLLVDRLLEDDGLALDGVLVLNPDVVADPDLLAELAGFGRRASGPILVGPVLELADSASLDGEGTIDTCGIVWDRTGRHFDDQQGRPIEAAGNQPRRVAGVSGACLYVPRRAYDAVVSATGELFDREFIAYREDAELGVRADLVGVESWVCPRARGRHVRGQRGTRRGASAHIDRLGVRNRFLIRYKLGRFRPGSRAASTARDVLVVLAVLVKERSSIGGLREAWELRDVMRAKNRVLQGLSR
jgi:GT2 family glycosyltransferase